MDKLGPYELNTIVTGDARELAKAIPDESVDLIFTDPVYQNIDDYRWLAEMAMRVLKDRGDLFAYCGHYMLADVIAAMVTHLDYRWLLVEKKISSGTLIWSYRLFTHYIPLLWFSKGKPRDGLSRIDFLWSTPSGATVNYKWAKNRCRVEYWLSRFSMPGDIIVDPFCGGGAILSGCKTRQKAFLGFEIDPETAEMARQRVAQTQPPLFVPQPEQAELETCPFDIQALSLYNLCIRVTLLGGITRRYRGWATANSSGSTRCRDRNGAVSEAAPANKRMGGLDNRLAVGNAPHLFARIKIFLGG